MGALPELTSQSVLERSNCATLTAWLQARLSTSLERLTRETGGLVVEERRTETTSSSWWSGRR